MRFARLFSVILFLGAVIYIHVWQRVEIVRLGYEIARREDEKEELLKERRLLRLEFSRVSSFSRLDEAAARELGDLSGNPEIIEVLVPRDSEQGKTD